MPKPANRPRSNRRLHWLATAAVLVCAFAAALLLYAVAPDADQRELSAQGGDLARTVIPPPPEFTVIPPPPIDTNDGQRTILPPVSPDIPTGSITGVGTENEAKLANPSGRNGPAHKVDGSKRRQLDIGADRTEDEGSSFEVTVTLSEASTEPVTVSWRGTGGTATEDDYGATSAAVGFEITDDSVPEGDEHFFLNCTRRRRRSSAASAHRSPFRPTTDRR